MTVTVTQTGDFVASGNLNFQTVTIPPSGSMTHTVATMNDNIPEANGLVRVTVSQGAGYTVGSLASAAVRVNDDDGTSPPPTAPTVTIMGGPSPITEGTAAAFTVSRSGPVTAPPAGAAEGEGDHNGWTGLRGNSPGGSQDGDHSIRRRHRPLHCDHSG